MKHTKTILAVVLLFALLLCSCGLVPPQAAAGTREAAAETRMTAQAAPAADYSLQPLAASGGQPAPTTVKSDLFRAKFEGSAVAGSGEAVDGVYRFAATKTDGEAWHVKLESNYPTVAGRDYRVTYRFRSDVAGTVKFGDFQEFKIREGENSVTGVLIATSGTSYLDLQLGMLPPFTIDFSEVEVKEYADEVDYEDALTTPVNFEKETIVYERHDQGYAPVLTRSSDQVSINYVAAPWDPGVWRSRLYAKTSLIPAAGTHYRVTADVEGDQDMPFEILFNNGDEEKGYGALYGQNLVAGQVTHCEAVITGTGDGDNLVLQFSLGQAPEGSTVQVSNLRVEKILDHYSSMLPASFALDKVIATGRTIHKAIPVDYKNLPLKDFSYTGTDTVYEGHDDGYVVSMKESGSSATMKIAKAPASDRGVWKVRMYAATGVEMEPGTSYRVRFDLKSARNQGEYEVCFDGNTENAYGALYGRSLTAGGTDSVEYVITPQEDRGPLTIRLQLGKTDTTAGNTFTLSKLSVDAVKAVSTDMGGISYVAGSNVREEHGDGIEQSVSASGSSATLNVSQARSGGGVWSSRLFVQTGVVPEAGQRYRVSATVGSAQAIGDFEVVYDNGGTEDGYKAKRTGLSVAAGGSETVTTDITAPDSGCGELVLRFQLGNSPADNTVTVSNIQVCPITGGNETELPLPGFAYPSGEEGGTENNSFDLEANSGAEAALTGDGSSATATVTKPGDDWHVKLYAKPGLELEAGQTYTISMNVSGADGCTACYKNTATGAEDGFGTEAITSGTVTHTVTPSEKGGLEILLKIGNVPAGTAVTVSNIQIEADTPTAISVMPGGASFDLEANSGAEAALSDEGGSATATVTKPGDDWHVKLYAKPHAQLEAGKTYQISLHVTNAAGCTACFKNLATGNEEGFGSAGIGSADQTITQTVTPDSGGELEILLKIGNVPADTAVTVSGVQVNELTTKLAPASFDLGYPVTIPESTAFASFDLEANSGAEAALTGDGSSATATVTKPGDDWHVKLYAKPGVSLEAGKTYRISLNLSGAAAGTVCYKNTATGAEDGFGTEAIGSGTVTHTVTPTESGGLEILLKIGAFPAGGTITVRDVQIAEYKTTDPDVLPEDFAYPVTTPSSLKKNSFDLEANSGAEAALSGDGSSATATVTKPGDDWHVKFYAKPGLNLEAGKTYRISMDVSGAAGCTACYKNTATGAEDGFGTEAIGSGTVTHTVTPAENGTLEILLKIGNVPAGTAVKVSGLRVCELRDSIGENQMTDSLNAWAPINFWAHEDYAASLSNDEASASLAINNAPASGREPWKVKLFAETGKKLTAGKSYRISVDTSASAALNYEICYNNGAVEKGVGAKYDLTATTSAKTVSYEVTPGSDADLVLQFSLGNSAAGNTFTIRNVKVEELRYETTSHALPSFRYDSVGYISKAADDGYITDLKQNSNSADFRILKAPANDRNPWNVKLNVRTGFTPESNKGYWVSFDIDSARKQDLFEVFYDGNSEATYGALYEQSLPVGKTTYSNIIMPGDSRGELVLQLRLGKTDGTVGNAYTVSNLKIEEVTFEFTKTPEKKDITELWTHSGYLSHLEKTRDKATVRIEKTPASGKEPWRTKLFVDTGVTLKAGEKYRVCMDVKSIIPAPFEVCFNDGDTEKGIGGMFGLLSTPAGRYVEYVTYPKQDAHLVIQLSLGNCAAPNSLMLSGVSVEKAGAINLISDTIYTF